MTPRDDWQQKVDFLLEQQAQFYAGLARLKEEHQQTEQKLSKLSDLVIHLGVTVMNLSAETDRLAAEADRRAAEADKRMQRLEESQGRTDERLNVLINVVERYFSNGRN